MMARLLWYLDPLSPHQLNKIKTKKSNLDPLGQNVLDTHMLKIVREYDQEMPESQTADNPVAPPGRAAQPSRDTRKTK